MCAGIALTINFRAVSGPCGFLLGADFLFGLLADGVEFFFRHTAFEGDKGLELVDAVVFFGPSQALRGLVAFV